MCPDRKNIIKKTLNFAKHQYGKPYDYEFKPGIKSFFCSELVNESFKHAGYKTRLSSVKRSKQVINHLEDQINGAVDALHPICFLNGNFSLVYLSHNLIYKNNLLEYNNHLKTASPNKKHINQ